ncbi:Hypothetical_protein [Hexamita inflata]|uniref:Hypothetical_protein n=1 Tax=Hexamita inflata TaxID=28002 RepID=A0AA86NET2_9EUKA|nr:Hypothetical protein HINF_LOCUS6147 [Hexamita inflata]
MSQNQPDLLSLIDPLIFFGKSARGLQVNRGGGLHSRQCSNGETLKHHQYFSQYDFSDQEVPSDVELKFYNKILKVHRSHKQIRKIQAENKISKFRESTTRQQEYIYLKINEQIRAVNMKIEIWAQFIQNSNADQ